MNFSPSINSHTPSEAIQRHLPPKIREMLAPFMENVQSTYCLVHYTPERTFSGVRVVIPEGNEAVMIVVGKHFAFKHQTGGSLVREAPCEKFVWVEGKAQDHNEPKIISEYAESRNLIDGYHNDCSRFYLDACLKHLARVGKFHRIVNEMPDMPFSKVKRIHAQLFMREFKGYPEKIHAVYTKTVENLVGIAFKAWGRIASQG